jgi:hypothetical protein
VQLTFSGQADYSDPNAGTYITIDALIRPAGGVSCQSTYQADLSAAGSASTVLVDGDFEPSGPFTLPENFKPLTPGSYLVCAWAQGSGSGSGTPVALATASATFAARGPQVSELAVTLPAIPSPNRSFQIDYTTQTDQSLTLQSTIKPAGGRGCASSYELETLQNENNGTETDLLGADPPSLFGGPTLNTTTATEKAGNYIICTWIEGPTSGEVDAAAVTPVAIPAPTSKPADARLRITHAAASRKHGATIQGTTAHKVQGRILVYATCGKASTSTTPLDRNGTFSGRIKLPKTCRNAKKVRIGAVWAGSRTYKKQSSSETISIKK